MLLVYYSVRSIACIIVFGYAAEKSSGKLLYACYGKCVLYIHQQPALFAVSVSAPADCHDGQCSLSQHLCK